MDKTSLRMNYLSAKDFTRKFTWLIVLAWIVPAIFGLSFILFIRVLSPEQMGVVLTTPTQPAFDIVWLIFAVWYFRKYVSPITEFLSSAENKTPEKQSAVLECMKGFPLRFWSLFLFYLILAPGSVILSAEYYSDYARFIW